jgi:hypothetical protein
MEKVYPREPHTVIPQVFLREVPSGGRVAYFPWDIDRTFWEVLSPDHGKLLRNAVEWATNEECPLSVEGPGVLDVTYWKQRNSLTVHLVNLTNPMMMKGPVRELVAVGPHRVRARLPGELKVKRLQLLVAGGVPDYSQNGDLLEVTVPSVLDHEVIAMDV